MGYSIEYGMLDDPSVVVGSIGADDASPIFVQGKGRVTPDRIEPQDILHMSFGPVVVVTIVPA